MALLPPVKDDLISKYLTKGHLVVFTCHGGQQGEQLTCRENIVGFVLSPNANSIYPQVLSTRQQPGHMFVRKPDKSGYEWFCAEHVNEGRAREFEIRLQAELDNSLES